MASHRTPYQFGSCRSQGFLNPYSSLSSLDISKSSDAWYMIIVYFQLVPYRNHDTEIPFLFVISPLEKCKKNIYNDYCFTLINRSWCLIVNMSTPRFLSGRLSKPSLYHQFQIPRSLLVQGKVNLALSCILAVLVPRCGMYLFRLPAGGKSGGSHDASSYKVPST